MKPPDLRVMKADKPGGRWFNIDDAPTIEETLAYLGQLSPEPPEDMIERAETAVLAFLDEAMAYGGLERGDARALAERVLDALWETDETA